MCINHPYHVDNEGLLIFLNYTNKARLLEIGLLFFFNIFAVEGKKNGLVLCFKFCAGPVLNVLEVCLSALDEV